MLQLSETAVEDTHQVARNVRGHRLPFCTRKEGGTNARRERDESV